MSGTSSDLRQTGEDAATATVRRDRRAERRAATRDEILDAAWQLVREQGIAALSLRELGERVGMRAQSLYSYFASKDAIYDAMFLEGNRDLLARVRAAGATDGSPEERFRHGAHVFVGFAVEDPARSNLLFLRVLPNFEPSADAYAPAVEVLELARSMLAEVGITSPELLDMWTASLGGIVSQQIANDPHGDRWVRLVDRTVDMYLAYATTTTEQPVTPEVSP